MSIITRIFVARTLPLAIIFIAIIILVNSVAEPRTAAHAVTAVCVLGMALLVVAQFITARGDDGNGKSRVAFNAPDAGIVIDGVDVTSGLARAGDAMSAYMRTLSVFLNDGHEKIEEIKTCVENDDMPRLTTAVHGLRVAAANIGATALSEEAEVMEIAGRCENREYVRMNVRHLQDILKTLLDNIAKAIEANGRRGGSASVGGFDRESVKLTLARLTTAIDGLDIDGINAAAAELHCVTGGGGEVEDILQKTLIGEHDAAVALIEKLLEQKA